MALYDVPAPAKINLFLHVTGRRPDGYHLLQTAFRFVGLYDWLDFDLRQDGRIDREAAAGEDAALRALPAEQDLVVKAATALQRATGTRLGAQIRYRKHIPSGGGLGGGSSDAATTLIALNRMWNTGLDRDALMRLALPLGADVPVFIQGQAAFAEGIGERLSAVDLPDRAYLIVQPDASVPTAAVFTDPDLTRDTPLVTISVFADWQTVNATQDRAQAGYFGRNDLEPIVFARYPRVGAAAAWLAQQGVKARMTGSGACLFAEFASLQHASMYRQKIIGKMSSFSSDGTAVIQNAWACPGLADHPLRHWL